MFTRTDEAEMFVPYEVVACRGRKDGAESNQGTQFTRHDLDRIAPLSAADSMHLSKSQNPPTWVRVHVAARIQAAKQLKYGG